MEVSVLVQALALVLALVLSRTRRAEVVSAFAAAFQAWVASPAPPSEGGRGGAGLWPASCRP